MHGFKSSLTRKDPMKSAAEQPGAFRFDANGTLSIFLVIVKALVKSEGDILRSQVA